jgi:hypothetical protein
MATAIAISDELDTWKSYLSPLEKGDYTVWRLVDNISSFTTFALSVGFLMAGIPLALHYAGSWLSGIDEPHTSMTRMAARAMLPVAVGLVFSIALNLFSGRRVERVEALARNRKKEHDDVVHVTRQVVRAARMIEPVRANMHLRTL